MNKLNIKKWTYIVILILFVPGAVYLLATMQLLYFFIFAAITYGLTKLLEKIYNN